MSKKQSVKGGASSHLRPCKVSFCDIHNERLDENPSNKNIRPEYSPNNSVWKDPYVPSLVALDRQIREDYFQAHGRHLPERGPSKASPLKESVTLMPDGGKDTDDIQRRIVARLEKKFNIRCVRRYNHRDEYCEETQSYNWHGHEIWDMYDHENHRMIKLSRDDCREWQDIVAEETGMPRGNPAYETRRKWLSATEYKIKQKEEELEELEKEVALKKEDAFHFSPYTGNDRLAKIEKISSRTPLAFVIHSTTDATLYVAPELRKQANAAGEGRKYDGIIEAARYMLRTATWAASTFDMRSFKDEALNGVTFGYVRVDKSRAIFLNEEILVNPETVISFYDPDWKRLAVPVDEKWYQQNNIVRLELQNEKQYEEERKESKDEKLEAHEKVRTAPQAAISKNNTSQVCGKNTPHL